MQHRKFIEADIPVFWLHPIQDDGSCGCQDPDCENQGKHPGISRWQHTPVWSDEQLELMEGIGRLVDGYGVLLNGLLVVDVDARSGGVQSYTRLLEAVPEIAGAGLIVNTGSGGGSKHLYFRCDPTIAMSFKLAEYPGVDFKSGSSFVVGPGSIHKSGKRYEVGIGSPADIGPAPQALIDLLKKPEIHRAKYDGKSIDLSDSDIKDMLSFMSSDCDHDTWIKTGMAIHHATSGAGFNLWDDWSRTSSKYPGTEALSRRWHSFGKSANPVTIGTLIHYAKSAGWEKPVTFDAGGDFAEFEVAPEGLPFSVDGVDFLRPPGFVGEVAKWIENQSRRPRTLLATAAALTAIGNIAGLRYTDDKDGVTTNLFSFCVAGSRTGKESTQQAIASIHRAAGLVGANHGGIKSEQELVRNLIRHQASFYIMDEIGIFLKKVKNAQDRGGAPYLEAVMGMLMAAYSKADSFMLLGGDLPDEVKARLRKDIASLTKSLEAGNEDVKRAEKKIAQMTYLMDSLDNGLEKPFVSLIGFATPITFNELVDYNGAVNGFFGRAMIFNERETAPRSKKNFGKPQMTPAMINTLRQIYSPGEFDVLDSGGRIEYYGDRIKVATEEKAVEMLEQALDWFEDQAVFHKGVTGLEALYLGAYELLSKVSLILACPEGMRTTEHVRWAFALVKSDIEAKIRLVTVTDRAEDDPGLALRAQIANIVDGDGETLGVIYNRLRKHDKKKVCETLDKMVADGLVLKHEKTHPKNKQVFFVFQLQSKE